MQFETITAKELIQHCSNNFDEFAIQLFRYQYEQNLLYKAYCDLLKIELSQVDEIQKIPFLPISFFKSHKVYCGKTDVVQRIFESSGTTGTISSKHYVSSTNLYDELALYAFESIYGPAADWVILALLPSYLERKSSSLVHMVKMLIDHGGNKDSGFYLNDFYSLDQKLVQLQSQNKKVLLLGVSFALIDFAEQFSRNLSGIQIMETGGMKGRKEEWTRNELHQFLIDKWQVLAIQSEYGMTELLSQAYAKSEGVFKPSITMKVLIRDSSDPLETTLFGKGALNIIDMANVHSCAFIATEDLGSVYTNGSFEIFGRIDFSALRGCSLLAI